jgi:hypothetical protein
MFSIWIAIVLGLALGQFIAGLFITPLSQNIFASSILGYAMHWAKKTVLL